MASPDDTAGSSHGYPWHWAGAANAHAAPLKSPNADTAATYAYNLAAAGGAGDPQRKTYVNPTTAGDQRQFWGQGQPEAKDSVNDWRYGKKSKAALGIFPEVESRFAYFGTVAPTDLDRATDTREKGRVGFFGSGYSYAGSSPRVTSEKIGRDINPLGRGDGFAYVGGDLNMGWIAPCLPLEKAQAGTGSSVNNLGPGGGGDIGFSQDCACCRVQVQPGVYAIDTSTCWDELNRVKQYCGSKAGDPCYCEQCRYWKCELAKCLPTSPINVSIWYWNKKENLECCFSNNCFGSSGGGSRAIQCPGCSGGHVVPSGPQDPGPNKATTTCIQHFKKAQTLLKQNWKKYKQQCCCDLNCNFCDEAEPYILGSRSPLEAPAKSYAGDKPLCKDETGNERVAYTTCNVGWPWESAMQNNICCKHFTPPKFTACGGLLINTSNSTCAALVYLVIESMTCGMGKGKVEECCQDAIKVGECFCKALNLT